MIVNSNGSNIYVRIGVPTKSDTFISDAESMVLNAQGYNVVNLSEWEVANQTAQAISKIIGGI